MWRENVRGLMEGGIAMWSAKSRTALVTFCLSALCLGAGQKEGPGSPELIDPSVRHTPWKPDGLISAGPIRGEKLTTTTPFPVTAVRPQATCWDVSDSGQVVVGETSPGVTFKWTGGEATILDAVESWGYRINARHEIVGTRTNAQGYYRGVVWRGSGAIEIGTLDNVFPGNPGRMSWGEDINDAGVVAGTSHNLIGTNTERAVRWT